MNTRTLPNHTFCRYLFGLCGVKKIDRRLSPTPKFFAPPKSKNTCKKKLIYIVLPKNLRQAKTFACFLFGLC